MNCKQLLLGVSKFCTAEEALTLLRNMSYFEDKSTSESEIEGDSSDSSEYTPEQQYQVRTNSNIQTFCLKKQLIRMPQNGALLADETATTSGEGHVAYPQKYLKPKKYPKKDKKLC